MITFTQMKQQAADLCGIYTTSPEMIKIARDINTGVKLFQNAARRYWTRREKKTNLVANQQFYQFPSDMLRISSVRAKSGDTYYPLTQIRSEDEWDKMNMTPVGQTSTPVYFFVKGADEIGLYPIPSTTVADGIKVSYEPRMVDMAITDVVGKADVVQNSVNIVAGAATLFSENMLNDCWFTVTDGSDGNWYKIVAYTDTTHIGIDNNYQGLTKNAADILIGQCPSFPEEYHEAAIYYACKNFYLMRKDLESSSMYSQLFDRLFNQYREVYGSKTTGGVINPTPKVGSTVDPFSALRMS